MKKKKKRKLPLLSYFGDKEEVGQRKRLVGGEGQGLNFICPLWVRPENSLWYHAGKCKEAHAERGRGWGEEEGEEEEEEWAGVNFNMSFLKLSFDNWQFVRLVKCQESNKIDEVHNRCLRLTLRCGRRVPRTHQTTETILKWDGNTNRHRRSWARRTSGRTHIHTYTHEHTLGCWRAAPIRKPLGVNLVCGRCDLRLNMEVSFKRPRALTEGL